MVRSFFLMYLVGRCKVIILRRIGVFLEWCQEMHR